MHDVQFGILRDGDRREFFQIVLSDNDTAGVHAGLTYRTFQLLGIFHRSPDQRVFGFALGQQFRGLLKCLFEGRSRLFGNQFRNAVALRKGQFLYTRDILDRSLRRHRAESNDLRHPFAAVLFDHIVQYVGTAVLIEIDIDIGQGDTVGIQETLEQQVVLDRVDIGNTQRIGHHRTGSRTTARSHRYPQFPRGTDKVPYDKEVTGKPIHSIVESS